MFQEERFADIYEEMLPLLRKHYKEAEDYPGKLDFNLSKDSYLAMEDKGIFHVVTARVEGKLVGYICSVIYPNPHCLPHLYAINDGIFVDEAYRGKGIAKGMIEYAENMYKLKGVSVVTYNMKLSLTSDNLMASLGYKKEEIVYMKLIGD